jgi:hypothetical protein
VLLVLTSTLSDSEFLSWGWRVAFWLSAVVLIGYYIRTKVADAPIFVAAQREAEQFRASSFSAVEVLRRYPRGVHVRPTAGDDVRDVPHQDALFRCLPWLSGPGDQRDLVLELPHARSLHAWSTRSTG